MTEEETEAQRLNNSQGHIKMAKLGLEARQSLSRALAINVYVEY